VPSAECRQLGGCSTGEAKITNGYRLPARYVIHTVGPIWRGGTQDEPQLLRDCYHNSLRVAARHKLATIAFPAISTGAYSFPADHAAEIALNTTLDFLHENTLPSHVTFVCFSTDMQERYERILEKVI
jgi:O-acetyl-ADP-ribose deacetylase (regulator of RNase III)